MVGSYVGEIVVFRAPADGQRLRPGKPPQDFRKGDPVYLHMGHSMKVGNFTVTMEKLSREGYPFFGMEAG